MKVLKYGPLIIASICFASAGFGLLSPTPLRLSQQFQILDPGQKLAKWLSLPPQPGEIAVDNFVIEREDQRVEIQGVCKLNEDQISCWKPTGEPAPDLASIVDKSLKSPNDYYSSTFNFRFQKKNRILVLTTTTHLRKSDHSLPSNGVLFEGFSNGSSFDSWSNSYFSSNYQNSSQTGEDRVNTKILVGSFSVETEDFPLRYQFTVSTSEAKVIPFQKGKFTVDGNTYEIQDIVKGNQQSYSPSFGGGGRNFLMRSPTQLKIHAVKITNPNTILYLFPANAEGKQYAGFDDKGQPVTADEFQKIMIERQRKLIENQKNGMGFVPGGGFNGSYMGIQSIQLDPLSPYTNETFDAGLGIEPSKIKNFVVPVYHRTIYVFNKVRVDPK